MIKEFITHNDMISNVAEEISSTISYNTDTMIKEIMESKGWTLSEAVKRINIEYSQVWFGRGQYKIIARDIPTMEILGTLTWSL